jgi:hypothetical protein
MNERTFKILRLAQFAEIAEACHSHFSSNVLFAKPKRQWFFPFSSCVLVVERWLGR